MNNNQTTRTPRPLPSPPGQRQPQPAQRDVAQHLQRPRSQASPAPAYNPQRTVPQPSRRPPLEQSATRRAFNTNYDYGSQWHGQQHLYHVPPPVAQPPPRLVSQPNYHSYQPTAGYARHHVPQPVASPQPQLAYYPHPQPQQQQQQQRLCHAPPQHLMQMPARCDSPNWNREQHHAPLSPRPLFEPPLSLPQNTGVYSYQTQGPGRGDGRSTREWSMSGNMADMGWGGSDMDSSGGGRRAGQSGGGAHAHGSGEIFGGAASIQIEGRNTISTSAEPAVVPLATQLQGAQNVNVSGNPTLMNIGTNTGNLTTVNNYGGTHALEDLKEFVSFAALHNSAEQDHSRRCHPGTRENVLKRLRHWIDNHNSSHPIFWLHGPAGAGKSAIAQTIAHAYKRREVAATFFFYRSDPNRNDGNRLFTTMAWQFAFSIPAIKDFIIQALDKLPHLPRTDVETQFEELVAHPFHAMNHIATQVLHPAPVVIIDGVDECFDEQLQRRFLTIIGDAVKDTRIPLRFLIVSRPEALIEETLNKFQDFTASIDLANLHDSNRDIHKYLRDKFFEIASNRDLDPTWPGQEIITEVVFKSSGNFIFASLVIRFISDEDCDPEFLLDIVRNLTPRGNMSPFALLDDLFLEILKRQRDQDFLKTFLALLIGRSSIMEDNLHKDDATLMNVSEKDLHIRLRRMRSLLKFEPFIDVYHKSFLDFLQDSSRSSQYHVSKQGGLKRYLELVVDSVVRHVSMAIEQPNCHRTCRSSPVFKSIVMSQPPKIVLPVEDWQEALKPLLDLQDKLLKMFKPKLCRVTQIMRDLLLHLVISQGKTHSITTAQAPESNMNNTVTEWSPALVTEAQQNIPETDVDTCLSVLLSCLQKMDSVMVVDRAIIDRMSSLLAFDYGETVARVRTVSDAQKLIDLIALLANNRSFLSQCGRGAAGKAARLGSEIFARVPLLPQSLFLNKPGHYIRNSPLHLSELDCQSALISRILDHNCIVPVLGISGESDSLDLATGPTGNSVTTWLTSSPDLVTKISVILEVARIIRYIHSMDVVLDSGCIQSDYFFLNSNLCAKFNFSGSFASWVREASIYHHEYPFLANYTFEYNLFAFALLFQEVCFGGHNEKGSNRLVEDALQLIKRCSAKTPPTMKEVVTEMETWNLT